MRSWVVSSLSTLGHERRDDVGRRPVGSRHAVQRAPGFNEALADFLERAG